GTSSGPYGHSDGEPPRGACVDPGLRRRRRALAEVAPRALAYVVRRGRGEGHRRSAEPRHAPRAARDIGRPPDAQGRHRPAPATYRHPSSGGDDAAAARRSRRAPSTDRVAGPAAEEASAHARRVLASDAAPDPAAHDRERARTGPLRG